MREIANILLSPVNRDRLRWGQHPQAPMSLLSVIACLAFVAVLVGGMLLQWLGVNLHGPVTTGVAFGSFGLVFLAGCLDNRRERRKR